MNAANPLAVAPSILPSRAAAQLPPLPPKRSDTTNDFGGSGPMIGEADLLDPPSPTDPSHFASATSPNDPYADLETAFGRSPMYPGDEDEGQGVSTTSAS